MLENSNHKQPSIEAAALNSVAQNGQKNKIQQQQKSRKKRIPSDPILHSVAAIAVIVVAVAAAAVIASIAVVRVSWPFYTLAWAGVAMASSVGLLRKQI